MQGSENPGLTPEKPARNPNKDIPDKPESIGLTVGFHVSQCYPGSQVATQPGSPHGTFSPAFHQSAQLLQDG